MTMPGDMTRTDRLFHKLVREACRCQDETQARRLLGLAMALMLKRNRLRPAGAGGHGGGGSREPAPPAAVTRKQHAFLTDALGAFRRSTRFPDQSKFRRH
jgi:hypothetical protein